MLGSLLIALREVLEAGLVVSIVLAAVPGVPGRSTYIGGGVAAGVIAALMLAVFGGALSTALAGAGRDAFMIAVLALAVAMLSWHVLWMSRHGRELALKMRAAGSAVVAGEASLLSLALVVAIAVLREGSELVLFVYGIAVASNEEPSALLAGVALGIAGGALISVLLYRGLVVIPMRYFFSVTNAMVALLAAGMAGQVAARLARLHVLPTLVDQMWDTSWLLTDRSVAGSALRALLGYSSRPSGIQVLAYAGMLIFLLAASHLMTRSPSHGAPQPQQQGTD
jgi:high-affinity iron transporter